MTNDNPAPTADDLNDLWAQIDDHGLTEDSIIRIANAIRTWGDSPDLAEQASPDWLEGFKAGTIAAAEYMCACASIRTPLRDTIERLLDEGLGEGGNVDMN